MDEKKNGTAGMPGWHIELALVSGELADLVMDRPWAHEPKDETAPHLLKFLVKDGISLKTAFADAAREYLRTEEGKEKFCGRSDLREIEDFGYETEPFTWKDAHENIPDAILSAHGLARLADEIPVHQACTDEALVSYKDAWGPLYQGDEEEKWASGQGFRPANEDCNGDCGECPYRGCAKLG